MSQISAMKRSTATRPSIFPIESVGTPNDLGTCPAHAAANQDDSWINLRRRLLRYARMVVREPALAEDLAQQSLVAMLEHPQGPYGDASLTTWATAILKHKIADWYRSPYQHRRALDEPAESQIPSSPGCDTCDAPCIYKDNQATVAWTQPEGKLAQRQIMMVVDNCVGALPDLSRKVFTMHECLGFETSEISDHLGVSNDNCRTILHRARVNVRHCVTAHGHSMLSF